MNCAIWDKQADTEAFADKAESAKAGWPDAVDPEGTIQMVRRDSASIERARIRLVRGTRALS